VTEEHRNLKISFRAAAADPDGLESLRIFHTGNYTDGKTKVAEGRETINGDIEATRLQPGTNIFTLRAIDQNGNNYLEIVEKKAPDAPFLADTRRSTDRAWDDVPRDLDFMEFYTNDIKEGEGTVKATGNYGGGWSGIEEYILDHLGDYGEEFHWVQRGVRLVSDALDVRANFRGSGGFVDAQVPGVKKFVPEITERIDGVSRKENSLHPGDEGSYDDKFLEWEANGPIERFKNHEQGLLYDWDTQTLWTHEPIMSPEDETNWEMNELIRPFEDSVYKNDSDGDILGLDYRGLMNKTEGNGNFTRADAQVDMYGSILLMTDSSGNDFGENVPAVGFTDSFGNDLSDALHERNGKRLDRDRMESLIDLSEIFMQLSRESEGTENLIIDAGDTINDFQVYRNVSREQRDQVIAGDYEDLHADVLGYDPEDPVVRAERSPGP
jgi:hypothetical protein